MSDDVYLLDSGDDIFLWVGRLATKREKRMGMDVGLLYLEKLPKGGKERTSFIKQEDGGKKRGEGIGFYLIEEGNEPLYFTSLFHAWTDLVSKNGTMVKRDNRDPRKVGVPLQEVQVILAEQEQKISYQVFFLFFCFFVFFCFFLVFF